MSNIHGFDELQRNLDRLRKNIESLHGKHEISFNELFPSSFLVRYTNFTSFDDMLAKSGFKVETKEDVANIPDVAWNAFVAANTRFANWREMQQKAFEEYAQPKLRI